MPLVAPRTPPGVLELLPAEQLAFQRVLDLIRHGFERFGFLPVETPAFELTDVLLTKTGGETEKQVYFVQSTGSLEKARANPESSERPELALRFDLTVPLARYVAQHEKDLHFPFRRYQMQRVYRGERNQKGRFREFYQCDIDVVGKDTLSLRHDAELPAVIYEIFQKLAFGSFTIRLNNRKLLKGILEALAIAPEQHTLVLHEVDRLDKSDRVKVEEQLVKVGLSASLAGSLLDTLSSEGGNDAVLARLEALNHPALREGLAELRTVYDGVLALGVPASVIKLSPSTVRGLDYYTGTVYETFLDGHERLGSICSGGRYENLAGLYTKSKLPGVGISIGATRLFDQLRDVGLIQSTRRTVAHALVLCVEESLALEYAKLGAELRGAGFNVEVYASPDKLGKQFKYADLAGFPLAVVLGGREQEAGQVKLKDLRISEKDAADKEVSVPREGLVDKVRELLG